jgi:uncharacterized protein with PQ loop repeat
LNSLATELIGWASAVVLLLTIGKQVHKQWHDKTSEGVSKWLFIGQVTASLGFSVYSLLLKNWVFLATNLLILVSAIAGEVIFVRNRRLRER